MSRRLKRSRSAARAVPTPASATPSRAALVPLGALAAGFGLMLGSGASFAQTAAPAAPAEAALPEVKVSAPKEQSAKESLKTTTTTVGKGNQEIRDIPQSLTVVTEKLINDAKIDTLRQALHYTAGITFAATENGTDQDIRMRGFPVATTGDLMIDGMKDPSQYDRDTFNYDRIEVLRGSASMLFGRGSTGGVINQVTKKPMLVDVSEIVTSIGTGQTYRVTGDFSKRLGEDSAFRINAMANSADNYGARIRKHGLAPTISWGIGTKDEFTLGLFYLEVNNIPMSSMRYVGSAANGTVAEDIAAKNFYGTTSDYLRGRATYASGSWTHRFDDGGEVRTAFRTGQFKRDTWGSVAAFCNTSLTVARTCPNNTRVAADSLNVIARLGLTPRKDETTGTYVQSDYSNKFNWFGLRHEVLAGVDMSIEAADRFTGVGTVGANYAKGGTLVGTPNDGVASPLLPAYRKSQDYAGQAFGVYMQDLIWLTPQWKLLAGLRWDSVSANMHQLTYPTNTSPNSNGSASAKLSYPTLWSYRTGVLYQPTGAQSYHISYGTSFNTSADTYSYTTQQTANVDAEKSRNIEVGAKLDWLEGQLSTRFALYRTEKYNERTTDADFAGTFPVLSGKRHTDGVEMDVVGRITRALEIYLSYSYIIEAKIDKVGTAATGEGQPVGLTPRHTGALWLSYQILPKLRIAGGMRGASENRPLNGNTAAASPTAKAPGYVAFDAMAYYNITPDVFAQLNVINLTNKVYGDQLYPGFYTVGEGRAVRASLGMRF